MAKQRRMAALTVGLVAQAVEALLSAGHWPLLVTASRSSPPARSSPASPAPWPSPRRWSAHDRCCSAASWSCWCASSSARAATGAAASRIPRSRIYFANHSSHFDTLAVMAALPWPVRRLTHPVAALDYWGTNSAAPLHRRDCSSRRADRPQAQAGRAIRWRRSSGCSKDGQVDPDLSRGHARRGEEIAPFRSGIFRLASRLSRRRAGAGLSRQSQRASCPRAAC